MMTRKQMKLAYKYTMPIIRKINITPVAGEPEVYVHPVLYKRERVVAKYKQYIIRQKEFKRRRKEAHDQLTQALSTGVIYGCDFAAEGKDMTVMTVSSWEKELQFIDWKPEDMKWWLDGHHIPAPVVNS